MAIAVSFNGKLLGGRQIAQIVDEVLTKYVAAGVSVNIKFFHGGEHVFMVGLRGDEFSSFVVVPDFTDRMGIFKEFELYDHVMVAPCLWKGSFELFALGSLAFGELEVFIKYFNEAVSEAEPWTVVDERHVARKLWSSQQRRHAEMLDPVV